MSNFALDDLRKEKKEMLEMILLWYRWKVKTSLMPKLILKRWDGDFEMKSIVFRILCKLPSNCLMPWQHWLGIMRARWGPIFFIFYFIFNIIIYIKKKSEVCIVKLLFSSINFAWSSLFVKNFEKFVFHLLT